MANASTAKNDDNDVQIPAELRDVIEESDDEYPLHFEEPDQLIEMFSTLEEKNLFLIQQGQEAEQVLETKKHEYDKLKGEFNYEIGVLKGSKGEIKGRIFKTDAEKNNLQNTTADE